MFIWPAQSPSGGIQSFSNHSFFGGESLSMIGSPALCSSRKLEIVSGGSGLQPSDQSFTFPDPVAGGPAIQQFRANRPPRDKSTAVRDASSVIFDGTPG